MNRIVTARNSDIVEESRFEPKLYIFKETFLRAKERFSFVPVGSFDDKVRRGQSPKPSEYKDKWSGKHNFIRTVDVKKQQIATETTVYLDDNTYSNMKSNRVRGGDILVSVVGNYLGSASVVPSIITEGVFNDNSARIRIENDAISPLLLSAFFNSKFGQQLIHSKATRTGQKILSAGNLKKLEVPIIEDKQIINWLSSASEKEDAANLLIFQAQKICYDSILPLFRGIKNSNSFSVNKSSFADVDLWTPKYSFPRYVDCNALMKEKFGTVRIGAFAELIKGDEVGSDNYIPYVERTSKDVAFIRTTDVVNYDLDLYPDFYVPSEIYNELSQEFKEGDVLFTKDGKIGVVAMVTSSDKVVIGSGFIGIRLKNIASSYGLTSEYLFTLLSIKEIGIYESKRRSVYASTIPHLREERVREMEIPILPQTKIDEITSLVKKAFELKAEKKNLIRRSINAIDDMFYLV